MEYVFYIGCYTGQKPGPGLLRCRFAPERAAAAVDWCGGTYASPSFLALREKVLYLVEEIDSTGSLVALDIGGNEPVEVGRAALPGTGACHLQVGERGAVAACYGTGHVASYRLLENGAPQGPVTVFVHERGADHEAEGRNPQRQERQHAHSANIHPGGRYVTVADLGLDKLMHYRLGAGAALAACEGRPFTPTPPGEGPRHMAFQREGRYAYLVTELGNSLFAYRCGKEGQLEQIQRLPLLPEEWQGECYAADVHLSPDQRYLYASNRGYGEGRPAQERQLGDSLALFLVEKETGRLCLQERLPSYGSWPRNFCITADGAYIVIANQYSGTAVFCPREKETGRYGEPICTLRAPEVSCIVQAMA